MKYILSLILLLEYGNKKSQIISAVMLGIMTSPFAWMVQKFNYYILVDKDFACIVLLSIIIDFLSGILKHWKLHDFDFKELAMGLLIKTFVAYMGMVLFSNLTLIQEVKDIEWLADKVKLVGKLSVLFYLSGSAFNNLYIISGGKYPPMSWMKRMKGFEKSLDISDLFDKKKTDQEIVEDITIEKDDEVEGNITITKNKEN